MEKVYLTKGGKIDIVVATVTSDMTCAPTETIYKNLTGEEIAVEESISTIVKGIAKNECLLTIVDEGDFFMEWVIPTGEKSVQVPLTDLLPDDDTLKKKATVLVGEPCATYRLQDPFDDSKGIYKADRVNNKIELQFNVRRDTYISLTIRR